MGKLSVQICPICAGKCIEKHEREYVVEVRCRECRQWRYQYKIETGQNIETISDVAYVLSESLSDEVYEEMERTTRSSILAAQKNYFNGRKTV